MIAESGSSLDVWALDLDYRGAAEHIAKYLSCPIDDDKALYDCVVSKSVEELVRAENDLIVSP